MANLVNKDSYFLAIKRRNNDYLPLEWNLTSFYNNEDMQTLDGIDSFTKKISPTELILDILEKNIVDINENFVDFVILFKEKGVIRELLGGACFSDGASFLNANTIYKIIYENRHDKQFINKIYNYLNKVIGNEVFEDFKFLLKNLDLFKEKGDVVVKVALNKIYELDYESLRLLGMYLFSLLQPDVSKTKEKEDKHSLIKNVSY